METNILKVVRYSNRKLYSNAHGSYLNYSFIKQHVKAGGKVFVTCHKTGKDLSSAVYRQLLVTEPLSINFVEDFLRKSNA